MPKRIVVLGGGISGLSLCWYLQKKTDIHLTLLEKEKRIGGWIQTSNQNGFLFEKGPRSFRPKGNGRQTLQLIEELGLKDEVIVADPSSHYRYLYHEKKLQKFPTSLIEFLFSPLMKGVIPSLIHEFFTSKTSQVDESIYDFFSRRLTPELAERFASPLVSGIYAGDIKKLSMQACFPAFYKMEQEHGSLIKALLKKRKEALHENLFIREMSQHPMLSFQKGMETLPDTLGKKLVDVIRLNAEVTSLSLEKEKIQIGINGKECMEADYLISTIPLTALCPLLSIYPSLVKKMRSIPYASIGVVNLGYRHKVLNHRGFGYLIPTQENEKILGCVWDSQVFPQQSHHSEETRLTVMLGGTHFPAVNTLTHDQLLQTSLAALKKHSGIHSSPDEISVALAKQAIPQYELGYQSLIEKIRKELFSISPRLLLTGHTFDGVAVNDCIANSKKISQQFN